MTVNPATISIDMGLGPMDIDVNGSGVIYSENLINNYNQALSIFESEFQI